MNIGKSTLSAVDKQDRIDWHAVRQRLDIARLAIEHIALPDPEECSRILKARAQVLARRAEPTEEIDEWIEVVEFVLAQERYAVELRHVRDVYPLEHLTPLPCTPAFVLGIVNLHGEILSVIDIKKFFGLAERGLTDLNKVIVLACPGMYFGILADAISSVRRIQVASIQRSLPTLAGIRERYLKGVTRERITILDAEALLADQKIVVHEQVHE